MPTHGKEQQQRYKLGGHNHWEVTHAEAKQHGRPLLLTTDKHNSLLND